MTEYNVFIHYNVKNNIWKEEVSVIKDRVKTLHNVKETLLKWWENAVTSQIKVYNKKYYLKTYRKEDLVLLLINVESIDVVVIKPNTVCIIYVNDTK